MSFIIINGDDFGMNERCSRAIAQAFREELITDTTAMANGAYFDAAVRMAKEQGFDDRIGIHFNLTEGEPLTAAIRQIPDFVDGGCFVKRYVDRPRPLTDAEQESVYAELTAQAQRLRRAGIAVTHADSHHYIHNIPYLAPIAARVCRENAIRCVRLQRCVGEPAESSENNRFWRGEGFLTTDSFCRMSDTFFGVESDRVEIMVHPDFDRLGRLIDRTGMDDGFPVGNPLLPLDKNLGITLLSYRDLA